MNEKYGGNPLSKLRRVPTEWAHKIGVAQWRQDQKKSPLSYHLKRGRKAFDEVHPEGMEECKAEFVKHYENIKTSMPHYTPTLASMSHTWHLTVKKFNHN